MCMCVSVLISDVYSEHIATFATCARMVGSLEGCASVLVVCESHNYRTTIAQLAIKALGVITLPGLCGRQCCRCRWI